MENNKSLETVYSILEAQEKEIFYGFHEDNKNRTEKIQSAMTKIDVLKIFGEDLNDDIVLLGDLITLEIDNGDNDIELLENQKLVISAKEESEIGIYSNVGEAVFAEKVGSTVETVLPNGEVIKIRILAKNKNIFEEKADEKTYTKNPTNGSIK